MFVSARGKGNLSPELFHLRERRRVRRAPGGPLAARPLPRCQHRGDETFANRSAAICVFWKKRRAAGGHHFAHGKRSEFRHGNCSLLHSARSRWIGHVVEECLFTSPRSTICRGVASSFASCTTAFAKWHPGCAFVAVRHTSRP